MWLCYLRLGPEERGDGGILQCKVLVSPGGLRRSFGQLNPAQLLQHRAAASVPNLTRKGVPVVGPWELIVSRGLTCAPDCRGPKNAPNCHTVVFMQALCCRCSCMLSTQQISGTMREENRARVFLMMARPVHSPLHTCVGAGQPASA